MRMFGRLVFAAALLALIPAAAFAQTSAIAGVVKDTSGAVLPGVTVEVSSPALIEKVRSAVTDSSGQYKITTLRPGTYAVTFTLPGFSVVKRENVELTSDFTATINADMKVGALEETITVSAESPIVDTQSITTRTVMTREVMDAIPTGRNIQAVGIMIPGTSISLGGGGALSRDVGGSGNLQQSPLQYRGSADTVQTIEGMRLNNLCANGAYSGVYWNDGSFQEFSYVTGADSAEMGQGGMRVNMVPKDGGNSFHGFVFGNYSPSSWASDNCNSAGVGQPCSGQQPLRRHDLQQDEQFPDQRQPAHQELRHQRRRRRSDCARPRVVLRNLPLSRRQQDGGRQLLQLNAQVPGRSRRTSPTPAARASTMATSAALPAARWRRSRRRTRSRTTTTSRTRSAATGASPRRFRRKRRRFRRRRPASSRCRSSRAPRATSCCSTPASRSTTRNTRRTTSRTSSRLRCRSCTISGSRRTGKFANAWNNPADHFSKLFTEQFAASYVTGAHSLRVGVDDQPGAVAADAALHARRAAGHLQRRRAGRRSTLRIPTDRRNSIKNDIGVFAQDRWTIGRATVNAGVRWDWFISATDPETLPAGTFNAAVTYSALLGREEQPERRAASGGSPTGRTSARASAWPTTCSATARPRSRRASPATSTASASRPAASPTTTTPRRPSASPTRAPGAISTATDRRSLRPARSS